MKRFEIIQGIIMMVNFFLVLGYVGSIEREVITLSAGFWKCVAVISISYILVFIGKIIQKIKNKSEKPLDKLQAVCYNKYSK